MEILRMEISAGRWSEGERFPSISDLVAQSGVSRSLILRALADLEKQGYLRQEERKGTFLRSRLPRNGKPIGAIGIATRALQNLHMPGAVERTEAFGRWRLDHLVSAITTANYTVSILPVTENTDLTKIDLREGPFGGRVDGIISFCAGPERRSCEIGQEQIPTVYLGLLDPECFPCVTGDDQDATYWMTRRLLELGHRRIALYCHPYHSTHHQELLLDAHRKAMNEAGAEANMESARESMAIGDGNPTSLNEFIKRHSDCSAIFSFSGEMAAHLCDAAEAASYRLPEDLSIVSIGHGLSRYGKVIASMIYDWDAICSTCMNLLMEQMRTRRCSTGVVRFRSFIQGITCLTDTLGEPSTKAAGLK